MKKIINQHRAVFVTGIFLCLSLIVPDNKFFFILSGLFVFSLLWVEKSFEEVLIYAFFYFDLIQVGQLYVFQVIRPEILRHPLYPEGRSLFFVFSPYFILILTSIFGIIFQAVKRKKIPTFSLPVIFFLAALLLSLFSAFFTNYLTTLSILLVITSFGKVCWLVVFQNRLKELLPEARFKLIFNLFLIFTLFSVFEGAVVAAQLAKRSTIGLVIEQVSTVPYFGAGADENSLQFRPIGVHLDPNVLANYSFQILLLTFLLRTYLVDKKKFFAAQTKWLLVTSLLVCGVTILFSQSRSVYLSLVTFITINVFFNRTKALQAFKNMSAVLHQHSFIYLCFVSVLSFVGLDRLLRSVNTFSSTGSADVRIRLMVESINLIKTNFFWGVGPGMFIPALFAFNPKGVIHYFPEPVHNDYLLFLSENGIFSAALLLMGIIVLFWSVTKVQLPRSTKVLIVSGLLSLCIPMLFFGLPNYFDIFFLVVPAIIGQEILHEQKRKN